MFVIRAFLCCVEDWQQRVCMFQYVDITCTKTRNEFSNAPKRPRYCIGRTGLFRNYTGNKVINIHVTLTKIVRMLVSILSR